jgi:DNA-directed RNA polymerase, mitochondrial
MPYDGGFYLINDPLIRSGLHAHTSNLQYPLSPLALRAINAVQGTRWRINAWILDLMRECWLGGDLVGGLPSPDDRPFPPKIDEEIWKAMSPEDRRAHKKILAEIHGENAATVSSRQSFLDKLTIAEQLRTNDAIWYPHFLDFRTRMYPLATQGPNPQGDDISKSLLMFADGKPVGPSGLRWLSVRLANCYGMDKLPIEGRIDWVLEHSAEIEDCYHNPLDGQRFWCEAEEPWSFLATAREYALAMQCSDPHMFISHLPIPMDGSCNGLQHLSAMGRDPVGARATNLTSSPERHDIYTDVANVVEQLIAADAIAGSPEAHAWIGKITRKTVKRAVMTTPYGVTERGIRDQLIADGHVGRDMPVARGAAADYLKDKIVEALSQTVTSARDIMGWLQTVAKTLANAGQPLEWTTPSGCRIRQSYHVLLMREIQSLTGNVAIWEENPLGSIDPRKQTLASAPNVIHSFDAAHLALTVDTMKIRGHHHFAMIHDSYGVHAADTDTLNATLRETFVEIYSDDWLARLYSDFHTSGVDIPAPPPTGQFDVNEVLRSQFFFS